MWSTIYQCQHWLNYTLVCMCVWVSGKIRVKNSRWLTFTLEPASCSLPQQMVVRAVKYLPVRDRQVERHEARECNSSDRMDWECVCVFIRILDHITAGRVLSDPNMQTWAVDFLPRGPHVFCILSRIKCPHIQRWRAAPSSEGHYEVRGQDIFRAHVKKQQHENYQHRWCKVLN